MREAGRSPDGHGDDFILRGEDGQLAELKALQEKESGAYAVYGSPRWSEEQKKEAGDAEVYNYKSGQKMYEKYMNSRGRSKYLKNFWKRKSIRNSKREAP